MNKKFLILIKEILNELKKINNNIEKNIEKPIYIETDNLEKEFPIEVIASHFEGRLLNIDFKDLKEFWDFITNEDVNISNMERFKKIINKEIYNQYPEFKILDINKHFLNEFEVEYLINWYKKNNGDKFIIKSIKKGYTKTLKNTR